MLFRSVTFPGSQIVVQATVAQGATGTLVCTVVDPTGQSDDPTVDITLAGAVGLSVNDSNATYANFAYVPA